MHPTETDLRDKTQGVLLVALALVSASTLTFEVLLTKLFANKLEHHYTFAILSIALLGFGAGGVVVHLRGGLPGEVPAQLRWLSRRAVAWAVAMPLASAVFIVLPLNPGLAGMAGAVALPVYFLLFAAAFLPAGVFVGAVLAAPGLRPGRVYAWDLVGAGVGAVLGPLLLPLLGAWASVAAAAALALVGAWLLRWPVREGRARALATSGAAVALACGCLLAAPAVLRSQLGFDILSFKYTPLRGEFLQFGPPAQVYWNPVARVEVSPTGSSVIGGFRYGLPRPMYQLPLFGRMMLVDGSANTRQWLLPERPGPGSLPSRTLWSLPYVLRPGARRALVMGAGGGVDILVAKAWGAAEVDAVELNPDIYRLLVGRPEDPERAQYTRWLGSDERTTVTIHNAEARHFVRARRGQAAYDVVLASGVDTLTAIQTAGNALSENFLYTRDAVEDYLSLLAPGGQLALTHWHLDDPALGLSPTLPLKMLVTYLEVLEGQGVAAPGKRVCVVSEGFWESSLLKQGADYTREEVDTLRAFADANGFQVVYDPFMPDDAPTWRPRDRLFRQLARASHEERARLLDAVPWRLDPATDDRPYFYWIRPNDDAGPHLTDAGGWIFPQASVRWMFFVALAACLAMVLVPALRLRGAPAPRRTLAALPFFAATGFAFLLAENALFLMLTLFVGGPFWSISIVLPSMLIGYGLGSALSTRLHGRPAGAWVLGVAYVLGFAAMALASSHLVPRLIGEPTVVRMVVAVALVTPFGALLGTAVPWFMEVVSPGTGARPGLAWMWSVSSAANVMGSLMFVPVCAQLGLGWTFGVSAALYAAALAGGWWLARSSVGREMTPPVARG